MNQNWRCGEKTGRPPQADGSCRSKALPVPRPLSGQPLMVARTQSCPYLDIFFFSHSDAASTEVVPKPSAKRPFGIRSSLSSPLPSLPPHATCDSHFKPPVSSCFRFSGSSFPESHTQFFSQLQHSGMPPWAVPKVFTECQALCWVLSVHLLLLLLTVFRQFSVSYLFYINNNDLLFL